MPFSKYVDGILRTFCSKEKEIHLLSMAASYSAIYVSGETCNSCDIVSLSRNYIEYNYAWHILQKM